MSEREEDCLTVRVRGRERETERDGGGAERDTEREGRERWAAEEKVRVEKNANISIKAHQIGIRSLFSATK